jgi:hypothetical protein
MAVRAGRLTSISDPLFEKSTSPPTEVSCGVLTEMIGDPRFEAFRQRTAVEDGVAIGK